MASVDEYRAAEIFKKAISEASRPSFTPSSRFAAKIEGVISGSHLTYRYILVTGLLGKATNEAVDATSLQAGAQIRGAYDARSLCHSVIVPLERRLLRNCLGGSNEPYLNKPARFAQLLATNAVRRGQDQRTLNATIAILSGISTSDEANAALTDAIFFARKRTANIDGLKPTENSIPHAQIADFGRNLLELSVEGQSAAAYFGTLITCVHRDKKVIVHPVNQSGASSREICDIDVRMGDKIVGGYEVKDKTFNVHDVEHAARKAQAAGLHLLGIVLGPRGKLNGMPHAAVTAAANLGVVVIFLDLIEASKMLLALLPSITAEEFLDELASVCSKARVKDELYAQIAAAARNSIASKVR